MISLSGVYFISRSGKTAGWQAGEKWGKNFRTSEMGHLGYRLKWYLNIGINRFLRKYWRRGSIIILRLRICASLWPMTAHRKVLRERGQNVRLYTKICPLSGLASDGEETKSSIFQRCMESCSYVFLPLSPFSFQNAQKNMAKSINGPKHIK